VVPLGQGPPFAVGQEAECVQAPVRVGRAGPQQLLEVTGETLDRGAVEEGGRVLEGSEQRAVLLAAHVQGQVRLGDGRYLDDQVHVTGLGR
jgi:hypothetical protein